MLLLVLACLSCVLLVWLRCAFGAAFSSTAAYFAIKPMHAPHRPTILLNCHSDNFVRLASTALIATGAVSGCGTAPGPGKKRPRAAGRCGPWQKAASGCGTTPALAKSGLGLRCKRWMTFRKFGKPQVKRVWPFVSYGIHRSPRRKNATRLPHGRIPGFGTWRRMMCDKTAGFGTQARQDRRFGTHLLAKQLVWYPEWREANFLTWGFSEHRVPNFRIWLK